MDNSFVLLSIFTININTFLLLLLLLLLLLWGNSCMMSLQDSQSRGSNETDQLALLAFKSQITHDPLHIMSSWNDSISYCEWPGVVCGGRRHPNRVKALRLTSIGLRGSLAPQIGNLSFLQEISLQNNSLHGEIPREVSFLFRLRFLWLFDNLFEGEIPPNISSCSNLMELRLSHNNLSGEVPGDLDTLLKLQFLSLNYNGLTGQIPPSIGNLSILDTISIVSTGLSGSIPDTLGQLRRLNFLSLSENKLSGVVPPTVYNLSSLTILSLGDNQLQGSLPSNLGFRLPNLQRLSFYGNHFHGSIPISISNLSKIEIFQIGQNSFSGKVSTSFGGLPKLTRLGMPSNRLGSGRADDLNFINTLSNCSRLTFLDIGDNGFHGILPNSIANLSSQLWKLSLGINNISGKIPWGIGNLVSLQLLSLFDNLLEGSIPTSIGRLQMLNGLYLEANRFTGSIPSSLGNLTTLIQLDLGSNHFQGNIPSSLGKCKNLLRLELSGVASLNGNIPREIFDLSTLIELHLSRNSLNGSLPLEVGQLANLEFLDVSENMLSAEIPRTLGACTSLEQLFMKGNLFQGPIPSSLSSLRGLQDLDLSFNKLSGFIPKYLATFKFLENLNLSFNNLEGEVSLEGVFRNLSAVSVVGNNKLCGGIPELHLPTCQDEKSSHVFKLMATICGVGGSLVFVFVVVFLIVCCKRKQKKESLSCLTMGHHYKISYGQLLKATDGFSSANLIGMGSFGSVYKGVLNHGETVVAVKVLKIRQRGASKSFMVECKTLRNIRHRNLVKIITSCSSIDFEGNDFKALVYEFMPGGNLESWLHPHTNVIQEERRHLNLFQRLNIAIDVATVLDYLHHHCHVQIIHCDLKPSNILLDDDLVAHLGDFGISRILSKTMSGSWDDTSSIIIKGSIGYIAPEYGAGVDVSPHGDIYSYGIILLEIFTGKQPTDQMFQDNFNLHCWAEKALGDEVINIIEPSILTMEGDATTDQRCMKDRVQECLTSIIRIGVKCSNESLGDRMDISDVLRELNLIRKILFGVDTHP